MTAVVETRGLTKRYGAFLALEDLNLKIEPGVVFGFIGPNGAGKTTSMRILATLLEPSAGRPTSAAIRWRANRMRCATCSATCRIASASTTT